MNENVIDLGEIVVEANKLSIKPLVFSFYDYIIFSWVLFLLIFFLIFLLLQIKNDIKEINLKKS